MTLDVRALKCLFLGYSPTQKGYKCHHPPTRKFFVSKDVTFVESQPFFGPLNLGLQGETPWNEDQAATTLPNLDLVLPTNLIDTSRAVSATHLATAPDQAIDKPVIATNQDSNHALPLPSLSPNQARPSDFPSLVRFKGTPFVYHRKQ